MTIKHKRTAVMVGMIAMSAITFLAVAPRAEAAATVSRISGADRYETAAEISQASFITGVPRVYLATGANFPDALAGGAAAAKMDGPVLLTQASSIPDATKAELDRLNPSNIVVLGGSSVVSDAVIAAADPYTDGTVTRIAGTDRYDTAAKLSASVFAGAADTVYVTTGANFPDALAGGAAAGKVNGPLLLVEQNAIPQTTRDELARLSAQRIVILGGTQAVSEGVYGALNPYSEDPVVRKAGANRFATSAQVALDSFPGGANKVFLATGRNFPDALAGGAAAAAYPGPVLLTDSTCIPWEVNDAIDELDPTLLVILGGTGAVSDAVLTRTECPILVVD